MAIDFEFRRAPKMAIVSFRWKGPWQEARIRKEWERLARWAASEKLKVGRWIFLEPSERNFEVALEVRGRAARHPPFRRRTLPASRVASVRYDPAVVEPRVIYHGLSDWLRWRKKDGSIRRVGAYREVYEDNPWTNKRAWARSEIQVVVR
jgi:DNA gyrase inhibitor GyrI